VLVRHSTNGVMAALEWDASEVVAEGLLVSLREISRGAATVSDDPYPLDGLRGMTGHRTVSQTAASLGGRGSMSIGTGARQPSFDITEAS
jgi:hypothetical protein